MIIDSTTFLIKLLEVKKTFFDEDFISIRDYNDIHWHMTEYIASFNYDVRVDNTIDNNIFNCSNNVITLNKNADFKELLEQTEEKLLKFDPKIFNIFSNKRVLVSMLYEIKLKSLKKMEGYLEPEENKSRKSN